MGMASRRKRDKLKPGEIIKARSALGMPPYGIYKVEKVEQGMTHLSAGRIAIGVNSDCLKIVERELPEPKNWLVSEIAITRAQLEICDCPDCEKILSDCEKQLEEWKSNPENQQVH